MVQIKFGRDLPLRQQLVITPELRQAIKILKLTLPELAAVVRTVPDDTDEDE